MAAIRITPIQTADGLQEFLPAWEVLVEQRPMHSPVWLLRWWEHFRGADHELYVLLLHAEDQLIGVAPLYRVGFGRSFTYRFLGSGVVCTDHTTWFAKSGYASIVGAEVAKHLRASTVWGRLQLDHLDRDDPATRTTEHEFQRAGYLVHSQDTTACWVLDVPNTWEAYLQTLSKSHRKRCRRLVRSYFDAGRVVVHHATAATFDTVWQQFLKLHASRWGTPKRPVGAFTDSRFEHFHHAVARDLLLRNQLRLCYLTCDGVPIAAEYQFFDQESLYAYQSGMTTTSDDQPGNLSLIATIQFAIDRGLAKLDLLRGDESYKAHWRAAPRPCRNLRIWPHGFTGCLEFGANKAKRWASSMLRGSSAAPPHGRSLVTVLVDRAAPQKVPTPFVCPGPLPHLHPAGEPGEVCAALFQGVLTIVRILILRATSTKQEGRHRFGLRDHLSINCHGHRDRDRHRDDHVDAGECLHRADHGRRRGQSAGS